MRCTLAWLMTMNNGPNAHRMQQQLLMHSMLPHCGRLANLNWKQYMACVSTHKPQHSLRNERQQKPSLTAQHTSMRRRSPASRMQQIITRHSQQ
jgi:hypothetical protein